MSTRICKVCTWEYPVDFKGKRCTMCGQPFDVKYCVTCKQVKPLRDFEVGRAVCKKCRRPQLNRSKRAHLQRLDERFDEWVAKVRMVPKNYPTLTEQQWLEACRYFDGCARCHSKDIDARGFLISAKLGGRYCDWNIIPLCEKCNGAWDQTQSLFRNAEQHDHASRSTEYRECLAKVVEYLGGKLDDAIGYKEVSEECADSIDCGGNVSGENK